MAQPRALAQLGLLSAIVAVVASLAPLVALAFGASVIAIYSIVCTPRVSFAFPAVRLPAKALSLHLNEAEARSVAPAEAPKVTFAVHEQDNVGPSKSPAVPSKEEEEVPPSPGTTAIATAAEKQAAAESLESKETPRKKKSLKKGSKSPGSKAGGRSPQSFGYLYHEGGVVGTVLDDVVIQARLPTHGSASEESETASDGGWISPANGYIYHALIGYNLAYQTIQSAGLRNLGTLFLVYVQRDGKQFGAVGPEFILNNGDVLGFAGTTDDFAAFCEEKRLTSIDDVLAQGVEAFASHFHVFSLVEPALVRSKSHLIGKTAKELGFRSRYNASIISITRAGATFSKASWGRIQLRAFDSLLLLKGENFSWDAPETFRDLKPPPLPFKKIDLWPIAEDHKPEELKPVLEEEEEEEEEKKKVKEDAAGAAEEGVKS